MASINHSIPELITTHEGGRASKITPLQELERSVMSCFLWEKSFYENGQDHASRLVELCQQVDNEDIRDIAIHARFQMHLRHVPLLLAVILVNKKYERIALLLSLILYRADEITEFLAIYWKDGKKPIPNQVKKGLALAFTKFNAYQLAKYNNQSKAVKLRDVMFLVHPKPDNEEQSVMWKKLANNELESPDTWEVALSSGANKKETFERLMTENKLGALAFIRNLRNMYAAGVANELIESYFDVANFERVLPFRLITAAVHAPQYTVALEKAFLKSKFEKLNGKTVVLVDVSGSMNDRLSGKSEVTRMDAAGALALLAVNYFENVRIFTFSESFVEVAAVNNFSLIKNIMNSQSHSGTYLGAALTAVNKNFNYDRLIIITDEQNADNVLLNRRIENYIINVGSYKNGIAYNKGIHISGFSENIFRFIIEHEKNSSESR
jgi:hypothetical protein